MTLEQWGAQNLSTPGARKMLSIATEPLWGVEPREVSLLYALWYIASAGNEKEKGSILRLLTTPGGAQESRLVGGSQRIPILMAKRLGDQVVLKSPVRRIAQGGGRVRVFSDKLVVEADQVIVAVPPALAHRIDFAPALPAKQEKLLKAMVPGHLIKWEAVYDTPFWRDQGLSGQVVSENGPANTTFDNSPPSGNPGIVFGFAGGDQARKLRQALAREAPRGGARQLRRRLRAGRGRPERRVRDELDAGGVDARLPGGPHRHERAAQVRPGAGQARRPRALGRHRDGRLLERLHGRRGALGRARGEGGPGGAQAVRR